MRSAPAALLALTLLAAAFLPGMAFAAEDHSAHGAAGPANPMEKAVTLYLDAAGGLSPTPAENGTVPAGPSLPNGDSAPAMWEVAASKNTLLDSSAYVELYATVNKPTLTAGGPEGAAFLVQLTHNGEPVEGAATPVKLDSTLLQPGPLAKMKVFLPQADLALKPGDTFGLQVTFYGLNPEGQDAVSYNVGGEAGSRMVFRLRMASLDEVDLPREQLGAAATLAPLEGFDFQAESKKDPSVKEFTLKAFQFGYRGGPIVVQNNTKVVLHLTVDESLSTAGEGHDAHGHKDANQSWDASVATPLHGFSLASYDPRLTTVEFDGLVTTLKFTAVGPGNYSFICTVVCGTGHGAMLDRMTIEGPLAEQTLGPGDPSANGAKPAPGFEGVAVLAALAVALVALRRR